MCALACIHCVCAEFARLQKSPPEHIEAAPLESDILTWHYVITGPKGSPYEGGIYHGQQRAESAEWEEGVAQSKS